MEKDLDLQKIPKLTSLPKKITTKKKVPIITMKEDNEEGEKVEKARKNWVDGEDYI